jgi:hypothetical protein
VDRKEGMEGKGHIAVDSYFEKYHQSVDSESRAYVSVTRTTHSTRRKMSMKKRCSGKELQHSNGDEQNLITN